MKKLFKIFILFILCLNFNQFTNAKPLPPGSGSGDVPANILILLDSSKSMNNLIGDGIPTVNSGAIVWNNERVFTYNHKNHGGVFKFNSSGERTNFTTSSYDFARWFATHSTDRTCDFGLNTNKSKAFKDATVTTNPALVGVHFVTGVTIPNTNISNEDLLFIGQVQPKNSNSSIIAINQDYECRLAIRPNASLNMGFDVSQNASGQTILVAYGRDGKNGFLVSCNFGLGKCDKNAARGKGNTTTWGRLYDGKSISHTSKCKFEYGF